ncbi:MAG: hypothetical protein U0414_22945 [Polyangiaceae bacterium]
MRVRRWGAVIGCGALVLWAGAGCGDKAKTKSSVSLDDDSTAAPVSSEERAKSRAEDATKLCAKLDKAGLKDAMSVHSYELDIESMGDEPEPVDTCVKTMVVLLRDASPTFWQLTSCLRDKDSPRDCAMSLKLRDPAFKKAIETLKEEAKREQLEKVASITQLSTSPHTFKFGSYGAADHSVTLDLPENLESTDKELSVFLNWKKTPNAKEGPSLSVMQRYSMPSMEEEVKDATGKVTKQEKTTDGFVLVVESEYSLEVKVVKKSISTEYGGDQAIECNARFIDRRALAAKDRIAPWLEKLCTMRIQ